MCRPRKLEKFDQLPLADDLIVHYWSHFLDAVLRVRGSIPRSLCSFCSMSTALWTVLRLQQQCPNSHPCCAYFFACTVRGRLSLTPLGRTLPMMMCITNTPFQEIPAARLSKTHEIMKIADLIALRTPPSLCTSPTGYLLYGSHAWNTSSRHASRCCSL